MSRWNTGGACGADLAKENIIGIGDEIMLSGQARVAQQTDPRKCMVTFQGVPRWSQWGEIWKGNPRIAAPGEVGDFQELPARDMENRRPYHTGKTPVQWLYNFNFRAQVGEIYLTDDEKEFGARYAGRIIIEPTIKQGASPNKSWGWVRWNKLVWLLAQKGIHVTQVGPHGTPELMGAEFVETKNFRLAAAVMANARACVLPEGGLHHAAAAFNIPGVVIFGGFTPIELTGYAMHRNIGASLEDACGMRTPCEHCAAWMESIKPEFIEKQLREILDGL